MEQKKVVDVAVALAHRGGKILLIQRKDSKAIWDKKWEFPGGKIETNETAEEAIVREVKEETGLVALRSDFLGIHEHDWQLPEKVLHVRLHIFDCALGDGEVVHEQGNAYQTAWAVPEEAVTFDLLKANADIISTYAEKLT